MQMRAEYQNIALAPALHERLRAWVVIAAMKTGSKATVANRCYFAFDKSANVSGIDNTNLTSDSEAAAASGW